MNTKTHFWEWLAIDLVMQTWIMSGFQLLCLDLPWYQLAEVSILYYFVVNKLAFIYHQKQQNKKRELLGIRIPV